MDQDMSTFIIIGIAGLILGIIISYISTRSSSVKKSAFNELQNKLNLSDNQVHIQKALTDELRTHLDEQKQLLSLEQSNHKSIENNLIKLESTHKHLEERYQEQKDLNEHQQVNIEENISKINQLSQHLGQIENTKIHLEEKLKDQLTDFEIQRKKSLSEFENIANRLFEEKTNTFSKQSKQDIEQLLSPLKENLKDFKQKVEETYDKESKERFTLESKIKELVNLNQQISKDANNLTNALKGQAKTQGNWGEMILENILEHSGLVKDREYFTQSSYTDDNGKKKQPDVIIKYPNDRHIVIDSKVSLVSYERFANCEDLETQKLHLAKHLESMKNHINDLSSKEYDKIDKSLDFVMLFVPIEPAYMTAIQYDQQLWNYAYKKRVLLISPTNLIAALKMVADIWKREHQNQNATKIAKRGEILYEKFAGFIADMEQIEKHIHKLNNSYTDAINKLSKGKGNLVSQAEILKKLGINPKKEISEKYKS